MKKPFKFIGAIMISICLTLGLSLSLQSILAAWNPPTAVPPGNNTNGPIYVSSSTDQLISQNGLNIQNGNLAARVVGGIQMTGGSSGQMQVNTTGSIITTGLVADGNTLYVASTTDRVGIGTINPAQKLEVAGNALITGNAIVNGAVQFTDANSTITRPAASNLAFNTAASERIRINNTGNIGIGNTSPTATRLDLYNGNMRILGPSGYDANGEQARLYFGGMAAGIETGYAGIVSEFGYGYKFDVYAAGRNGALGLDSLDALVIRQTTGNVGIATTTPPYALTVGGNIMLTGRLYDNTYSPGVNGYVLQTTGTGFRWVATSTLGIGGGGVGWAASGNYIYNTNTGNVGINSTTPTLAKLSIGGTSPGLWEALLGLTDSAMTAGNRVMMKMGQSDTPNNQANITFLYNSFGSARNYLSLGLHTNDDILNIVGSGNVGIGTSTPFYKQTIAGDLMLTGRIYDNTYNSGTNGMVLQSTGNGFRWVATSSLGITGSGGGGSIDYGDCYNQPVPLGTNPETDVCNNGYVTIGLQFAQSASWWPTNAIRCCRLVSGGGSALWTQGTGDNIYRQLGNVSIGSNSLFPQKLSIFGGGLYMQTGNNITWNNGDATIGALTGNHLAFSTYTGSALTEKMRILNNGNVGIGTTAPNNLLEVWRDQNAATSQFIRNKTAGSDAMTRLYIQSDVGGGNLAAYSSAYTAGGRAHFANRFSLAADSAVNGLDILSTAATSDIRFYAGGDAVANEKMRIYPDANGRLLSLRGNSTIGTWNNGSGAYLLGGAYFNSSGTWYANNTTMATIALNGGNTGEIGFYTGTGLTVGGNFSPTLTMAISGTGNVGIGNSSPGTKLDVTGSIRASGDICSNNGANCLNSVSGGSGGCPANYTFVTNGAYGGMSGTCFYDPSTYSASVGSTVLLSSNTVSLAFFGGSLDANIVKATRLRKGGTYKICYRTWNSCCWLYTQIYRNGVAVGPQYYSTAGGGITYDQCDVVGGWSANDVVEIHAFGGCSGCGYYQGGDKLDLYIDVPAIGSSVYPTPLY